MGPLVDKAWPAAPVPRPPHPAYPTITSAFMQAVDQIFNGEDAQKALTAAAKKIDEDIADNDGYPPFDGN